MKAVAAMQGSTIREFVQRAVERELESARAKKRRGGRLQSSRALQDS
jgi:hypothetical protein